MLKKIAEQVNADLAKIFDNIIKEIEAADSVENVKTAEINIDKAEKTLRGLMRTEINEANELYQFAIKLGVHNLEVATLRLIQDASGVDSLDEGSIGKIKQLSAGLNKIRQDIKNYLGEQIDSLVAQANELKEKAKGVDNKLYDDFNTTATNLAEDKDELLKDLRHAAQTIFNVRESLAERQGELLPKLALKNQIDTLKEQATKLKDVATGVDDHLKNGFAFLVEDLDGIALDGDLHNATDAFNTIKNLVDERAQELVPQLVKALELDELLKNEVMGAEIQAELKAIKAALAEDKADAAAVLKAVDDLKAAKTKMANKLLEWHKILSEYHNKGYHKEGVETEVVKINLDQLHNLTNQMLNGADGIKLDAETLNTATALAKEIADNLNTDIAGAVDTVQRYEGFHRADHTAAWQANTLVTFLRDSVFDVSYLKFVDKETRAKLAKDIKHIFDQIKIDRETGRYYLPRFYNQLGAVNHDDLKLICEAYDVVADDFGARPGYKSFEHLGATELSAKDKAEALIGALANVQRLDLLGVSPESREALTKDILEIGAKIKSTPGWIYGRTLSLDGVDQKETKNMQGGLEKILEFYNPIQTQMNVKNK